MDLPTQFVIFIHIGYAVKTLNLQVARLIWSVLCAQLKAAAS